MNSEKSCGCIVIRNDKVLVVSTKDDQGNIFWSFPKGHQEDGESDIETAMRETKEEVGIDVDIQDKNPIVVSHLIHGGSAVKYIFFFISTPQNETISIQEDEIESAAWMTFEEANSKLKTYYKEAWNIALSRIST